MEFTALWDSVNLASRLEGVNKFYGTYMCVSEDVYNETKDYFVFRYLDKIRVKWKKIWINIYELITEKQNLDVQRQQIFNRFAEAIELYLWRNFQEAMVIFHELLAQGDAPSGTYVKRCEMYLQNPPDDEWDGVWTMESK